MIDGIEGIRLCAMTISRGRVQAGLIDEKSGSSSFVSEGGAFRGYMLINADFVAETIVLSKDGQDYRLRITGGEAVEASVFPPVPLKGKEKLNPGDIMIGKKWAGPIPDDMDISSFEVPQLEPTEDEVRRNIDPNDAATWPEDYRGPGIERCLSQYPNAEGMTPEVEITEDVIKASEEQETLEEMIERVGLPKYEPTEDEIKKGIDPNDATTWPEDYLGPGIERYKLMYSDEGNAEGPQLSEPPQE
jgi:hypothetical protein